MFGVKKKNVGRHAENIRGPIANCGIKPLERKLLCVETCRPYVLYHLRNYLTLLLILLFLLHFMFFINKLITSDIRQTQPIPSVSQASVWLYYLAMSHSFPRNFQDHDCP